MHLAKITKTFRTIVDEPSSNDSGVILVCLYYQTHVCISKGVDHVLVHPAQRVEFRTHTRIGQLPYRPLDLAEWLSDVAHQSITPGNFYKVTRVYAAFKRRTTSPPADERSFG